MGIVSISADSHSDLAHLVERQLAVTPAHRTFITKRFAKSSGDELIFANELAGWVRRLTGAEIDQFCRDYDWICQLVLKEELHFRREGRYRLGTFQQALDEVYSNDILMRQYMNGLLMTSLWWSNHTAAMRFFRDRFLAGNRTDAQLLEIGPGHGLLLALAAATGSGTLEAWDVSQQSIENSRRALAEIGVTRPVTLKVQDLFARKAGAAKYDAIVLSEVLEHLEQPAVALMTIREILAPGGRLYINMPINSPAPDHLFLLDTPEEVVAFIERQGYETEEAHFEPTTNYTLEQARKFKLTISCLVIARPKGSGS